MYDVSEIRAEFPILSRTVYGKPLVYLDNGASAQKPRQVIEAVTKAYEFEYANVHRGLHYLSNLATDKFESVRQKMMKFLGAEHSNEIVFTSGSTEGLNLVSYGWASNNLKEGDEILLSIMEHHANIVPWYVLKKRNGIKLNWIELRQDGSLLADDIISKIGEKTKMIAITHMSNVLGSINDIKKICLAARKLNVRVVVDGSQAAVHMPVNVRELACDFYVVTGHKLYGPSGSGSVYINKNRLKEMHPFMVGGDMIKEVTTSNVIFNDPPHKFEAGTPSIVSIIGLGAALDFINQVGLANIESYERSVKNYAEERLDELEWLNVQGNDINKGGIFSFIMDGPAHAHDLATVLDRTGIAVRAGQHCAQPLMEYLGLNATCRASFAMYNTCQEVDTLVEALKKCHKMFN